MKPDDKDKLNQCLEILDTTDLGLSMVWLWTWSLIKDNLDSLDWDVLVSEDEAWELMVDYVATGGGFSLEHGAEDLYEHVQDWMITAGLIKEFDDED